MVRPGKDEREPAAFWLVGAHAATLKSDSYIYVFVNIRGDGRPEYIVAPSNHVAQKVRIKPAKTGSVWYEFHRVDRYSEREGWEAFGSPDASADNEISNQSLPGEARVAGDDVIV